MAKELSVASIFIFNGRGVTEEEIKLGSPDDSEAKNLSHHVRKCQLRYSIFTRRQAEQGSDIVAIKYMLIALIVAVCITSTQIQSFIKWAHDIL